MILTVTLNPSVDQTMVVEALAHQKRVFARSSTAEPGGKGVNTGKLLTALGVSNRAFVITGGEIGKQFLCLCRADSLRLINVPVTQATRQNLTLISRSPRAEYKINGLGPKISPAESRRIHEKIDTLLPKARWITLGGSLPPGLNESFYGGILQRASAAGVKTVYDGESRKLLRSHGRHITLIKPNRHEFSLLTGTKPASPEQMVRAAKKLLTLGIQNILVSLDADGALWITRDGAWLAKSPSVRVASTIGAGDSAVAGAIAGLEQFARAPDALRLAVACGSATASRPGSQTGSRKLIMSLLKKITVEQIAA